MCGQMDSWNLSSLPPELLDARLILEYDHIILVGGRTQLDAEQEFNQHYARVAARDDFLYVDRGGDAPDDRPIDEVVWQHFRDQIERSDHAPNDDHGSLRFSTALRGSGERVG